MDNQTQTPAPANIEPSSAKVSRWVKWGWFEPTDYPPKDVKFYQKFWVVVVIGLFVAIAGLLMAIFNKKLYRTRDGVVYVSTKKTKIALYLIFGGYLLRSIPELIAFFSGA